MLLCDSVILHCDADAPSLSMRVFCACSIVVNIGSAGGVSCARVVVVVVWSWHSSGGVGGNCGV